MVLRYKDTLILQIGTQCAPLLAGIKVSNLLIVEHRMVQYVYQLTESSQIGIHSLYQTDGRVTLLLYNGESLLSHLKKPEEYKLLLQYGYKNLQLKEMLDRLSERFRQYWAGQIEFPHESGVFFGYPIKDVQGFIHNNGQNFLYSGYWKVYDNVKEARRTFAEYERAKLSVVTHIRNGGGLDFT